MIQWLGEWLKEIIVLILLAAFIDLLLPSQGMQRYVHFLVALFLLMVMLQPLFALMKMDDWEKNTFAVLESMTSGDDGGQNAKGPTFPSVAAIQEEGEKLKDSNEQFSLQLMEAKMESELAGNLRSSLGYSVEELDVRLKREEGGKGVPVVVVDTVFVLLQREKSVSPDGSSPPVPDAPLVSPVEPVHIDVDVGEGFPASTSFEVKEQKEDRAAGEVARKIQWFLEEHFNLTAKRVVVHFDVQDSKAEIKREFRL